MFSAPPTPPHPHRAQQGQMIQLFPVSANNVTQQNLNINTQITDEIKKMFEDINGPIEKSEFGTFLNTAFDTLAILASNNYNRSKIHSKEIATMALISSHFISICTIFKSFISTRIIL